MVKLLEQAKAGLRVVAFCMSHAFNESLSHYACNTPCISKLEGQAVEVHSSTCKGFVWSLANFGAIKGKGHGANALPL